MLCLTASKGLKSKTVLHLSTRDNARVFENMSLQPETRNMASQKYQGITNRQRKRQLTSPNSQMTIACKDLERITITSMNCTCKA